MASFTLGWKLAQRNSHRKADLNGTVSILTKGVTGARSNGRIRAMGKVRKQALAVEGSRNGI